MSDLRKKPSPFAHADTISSGRSHATSRPKPTAEARAVAQRQKLDRERENRQESAEQKESQRPSRSSALKAGMQNMMVKRAREGYIQDQIGATVARKPLNGTRQLLVCFLPISIRKNRSRSSRRWTPYTSLAGLHICASQLEEIKSSE